MPISVGEQLLTPEGPVLVTNIGHAGVYVRTESDASALIQWAELQTVTSHDPGETTTVERSFAQVYGCLSKSAKKTLLFRVEVVLEITTGYRSGFPELARIGEPRAPFANPEGQLWPKCTAMAELLADEFAVDRKHQRRVDGGEIQDKSPAPGTIRNWVNQYEAQGLLGLVDGRSLRETDRWDLIDVRFREAAMLIVAQFDGECSTANQGEIERRIAVYLKGEGVDVQVTSRRLRSAFVAILIADRGKTTRQHNSTVIRKASGFRSYPAHRPGQVVAIDATRIDNLVADPYTGDAMSVEVLTAIDVATRVVLGQRFTPKSGTALDAGLLLYDVMRPFSMHVTGTEVTDWRYSGLPEVVDLAGTNTKVGKRWVNSDFSKLDGEHCIASVHPDAVRCDNGSIFVSREFRHVTKIHGIDLLLSRGKKPNDNPHVERWHETIQRALQQLPGYKGRNVSQRGSLVANEPLIEPAELEVFMHQWIALDYHRTHQRGIVVPGDPNARMTPLEMWDANLDRTGRIDVPHRPDLMYEFLPTRWCKIGHSGVDMLNLTFDSPALDPYRTGLAVGQNAEGQHQFHVDRHDLSRIWFRLPETGRIVPIPWRRADMLNAPLTGVMLKGAHRLIRARGGNTVLKRGAAQALILDTLGELYQSKDTKWRTRAAASRMRVRQSRRDHAGAEAAHGRLTEAVVKRPGSVLAATEWCDISPEEVTW